MKVNKLASELAKREKTKSQARIQAIKNIVGHISDIFAEDYANQSADTYQNLLSNGLRREKDKK